MGGKGGFITMYLATFQTRFWPNRWENWKMHFYKPYSWSQNATFLLMPYSSIVKFVFSDLNCLIHFQFRDPWFRRCAILMWRYFLILEIKEISSISDVLNKSSSFQKGSRGNIKRFLSVWSDEVERLKALICIFWPLKCKNILANKIICTDLFF